MVYNGETPGWPSLDQSQLSKLQTQSNLNRSSVTTINNDTTGNEQGYMNSQINNTSSTIRTNYSGTRSFNRLYIHNDWSREKKTKFSFQGGENRLMRLKAQKAPVTGGRVGK